MHCTSIQILENSKSTHIDQEFQVMHIILFCLDELFQNEDPLPQCHRLGVFSDAPILGGFVRITSRIEFREVLTILKSSIFDIKVERFEFHFVDGIMAICALNTNMHFLLKKANYIDS